VPLDGSTAALARLDACFDKNRRAAVDTNPFVSPSHRPWFECRSSRVWHAARARQFLRPSKKDVNWRRPGWNKSAEI